MIHFFAEAFQNPESSYQEAFLKMVLVLFSILGFVALCIWIFRRMNHQRLRDMNYHKAIKILETRPISPKTLLYLIEVGGQQILLSESQLDVRQLTTLDFSEEDHVQAPPL